MDANVAFKSPQKSLSLLIVTRLLSPPAAPPPLSCGAGCAGCAPETPAFPALPEEVIELAVTRRALDPWRRLARLLILKNRVFTVLGSMKMRLL
jgi:hypothetical protein